MVRASGPHHLKRRGSRREVPEGRRQRLGGHAERLVEPVEIAPQQVGVARLGYGNAQRNANGSLGGTTEVDLGRPEDRTERVVVAREPQHPVAVLVREPREPLHACTMLRHLPVDAELMN